MKATLTDEELLARVAEKRDKEAFQLLFERYGKAAFSVARYLTNNEAQSEDVVQDAMLAIWSKAGQYDVSIGTAKSWILSIVANRAMVGNRKRRNEKMRERVVAERVKEVSAAKPEEEEGKELAAALRQKLQELPAQMRQLIAMYYVCEMKQDEIARILSMPQSTVSHRIRESLAELRRRLEVSGLAAAIPLLNAESLGTATLEGHELSGEVHARVFSKLDVARHSVRAAAAWPGKTMVGLALLAAGAIAGTGWWLSQVKESASSSFGNTMERPAEVRMPVAEPAEAPLPKISQAVPVYWDFNTPNPPAEIQIQRGSWHWIKDGGPDGSGCWETDEEIFIALLKIYAAELPIRVEVETRNRSAEYSRSGFACNFVWSDHLWVALFRNVGKPVMINPDAISWVQTTTYCGKDGSIDEWANGQRTSLGFSPRKSEDSGLLLIFRGRHRLDNLRIETIEEVQVPDVSVFSAALNRIPVAERAGKVEVPNLAAQRGKEGVFIEFDTDASKAESNE